MKHAWLRSGTSRGGGADRSERSAMCARLEGFPLLSLSLSFSLCPISNVNGEWKNR